MADRLTNSQLAEVLEVTGIEWVEVKEEADPYRPDSKPEVNGSGCWFEELRIFLSDDSVLLITADGDFGGGGHMKVEVVEAGSNLRGAADQTQEAASRPSNESSVVNLNTEGK